LADSLPRFDDCLKLGKRIDEKPYMLPDPEILRKGPEDEVRIPSSAHIESSMSPHPEKLPRPRDSPISSRRRLNVFNDKKIFLATDLELPERLQTTLRDLIENGGGELTTSVFDASMYVGRYRDGKEYVLASRRGINVGNLSWLFHMITNNEWTSPLRRLLHYPVPRNGIPGFENFRITLSNYGGEARVYLENLVIAAGGEFTKSMKQDNTHLITARKSSEKCAAAEEWNINMINHLWMEESYARCEVQRLTDPRYTHFPPRTNLGEVIGQTHLHEGILEELYYPHEPELTPEEKRLARGPMQTKSQNANVAKKLEAAPPKGGDDNQQTDVSMADNDESLIEITARSRKNPATPSVRRVGAQDKENETPSTTGSRGAKDRAISALHDLAPDFALYEKEKKRASSGGVWGGKRAADKIDGGRSKKRSVSPAEEDQESSSDIEEEREVKKPKIARPPTQMKLLITGYQRWVNEPNKEEKERVS
jgi:hypothetical protein